MFIILKKIDLIIDYYMPAFFYEINIKHPFTKIKTNKLISTTYNSSVHDMYLKDDARYKKCHLLIILPTKVLLTCTCDIDLNLGNSNITKGQVWNRDIITVRPRICAWIEKSVS